MPRPRTRGPRTIKTGIIKAYHQDSESGIEGEGSEPHSREMPHVYSPLQGARHYGDNGDDEPS
eukprot:3932925-Rhodomonas_salina.1